MSRGEDFSLRRCLQHPLGGHVAATPYIGGEAGPVKMHVHHQGGRSRMISKAALLLADLRQVQAQSAQFLGHCGQEVTGCFKFFEVLIAETVVPVVAGRPLHAALE